MAESKVDIDPIFQGLIEALRAAQAASGEAQATGQAGQWMMPDPQGDWDGSLWDWDKMGDSFSREDINEAFVESIRDAENSGVTGDTVAAITMVEYLAIAERAFRARHTMRRPRAMAHAMGRARGHGNELGTLTKTALEYVRRLVQASRAETTQTG